MRKEFMDGLRGWASLVVLFSHLGPCVLWAYSQPKFLPTITDGQLAVYVFFVISGFALSIQFLETGDRTSIIKLALRRYPRLTIPIVTSCVLTYLLIMAGATYNIQAGRLAGLDGFLGSFYNFDQSIRHLFKFSLWGVYFEHDQKFSYNPVLWTMRHEMAGSLLLFALLFIFGAKRLGMLALSCAGIYLWKSDSILIAFVFGACIAKAYPLLTNNNRLTAAIASSMLLAALWVAMFRDDLELTSYRSIALIAAVITMSLIPLHQVRSFLSNPLSLFLGKISFPLYLVHILVISTWTSWLYTKTFSNGTPGPAKLSLIGISSVIAAIASAIAFSYVERFAIHISRQFSDYLLRLWETCFHYRKDRERDFA